MYEEPLSCVLPPSFVSPFCFFRSVFFCFLLLPCLDVVRHLTASEFLLPRTSVFLYWSRRLCEAVYETLFLPHSVRQWFPSFGVLFFLVLSTEMVLLSAHLCARLLVGSPFSFLVFLLSIFFGVFVRSQRLYGIPLFFPEVISFPRSFPVTEFFYRANDFRFPVSVVVVCVLPLRLPRPPI